MVTKDNEASRFNTGKPMYSFIDFNLWKDTLGGDFSGIQTKEACMFEILCTVSDIAAEDDETFLIGFLRNLKALSYRLSLMIKKLPCNHHTMLDLRAFEDMARVLEFGAKKYSRNNWRKGYVNKYSAADSLLRHLQAMMIGEEFDPESGLHHIGHLMCNVMFLTNDLLYIAREENGSISSV